jgi:F-type H+-transporting ATPase subunit epsilon
LFEEEVDMIAARSLQLVLVTPEKTLVDEPVSALRFPLYDGQIGILPGRAPLIGRLGYGELKVSEVGGGERSYYIDGGFVQVKGPVVSILTNRAVPAEEISVQEAESLLQQAISRVATTDLESAARARDQVRARRMLALVRGSR